MGIGPGQFRFLDIVGSPWTRAFAQSCRLEYNVDPRGEVNDGKGPPPNDFVLKINLATVSMNGVAAKGAGRSSREPPTADLVELFLPLIDAPHRP